MQKRKKGLISVLLAMFILAIFTTFAMASSPMPGAIWTTDLNGDEVNKNIYDKKEDVYLNGGPLQKDNVKNPDARFHLPDGDYWVKVTDPSGNVLLGMSTGTIEVTDGTFRLYQLWDNLKTPDGKQGYLDTPNNGGEYKVWVSEDKSFTNNASKTDNFKVKPQIEEATLKVITFYDKNLNGIKDAGECLIEGVDITIDEKIVSENLEDQVELDLFPGSKTTWGATKMLPGYYVVTAKLPAEPPVWKFTTENPVDVTLNPGDSKVVEFGLVYLESNAKTIGFWSNKNGASLWKAEYLAGLNLRDTKNNLVVFSTHTPFRNWLLSANAENMAYMLSAQLSAMKLNVAVGFVSGESRVWGTSYTVNSLINASNESLASENSFDRTAQEILKNLLDDGNNNLNIVVTNPACVDGKIILPLN